MTSFRIEEVAFTPEAVAQWGGSPGRQSNWPVVYTIGNSRAIYVGETGNAVARMRQHLQSPDKADLTGLQVIFDETFNKSACHVRNRNTGITDADVDEPLRDYLRPFFAAD